MKNKISRSADEIKIELANLETELENCKSREQRRIVIDATVEKLAMLLQDNPYGLMNLRDELAGVFKSMEKAGRECDRAFWLAAWSGKGSFSDDRVSREGSFIPHVCLSLFGTIQPGKLLAYLQDALGGHNDDGFFQRLQVLVYPDVSGGWDNVDRPPNQKAEDAVFRVVEKLDASTPGEFGAKPVDGEVDTYALRFETNAQDFFDVWRGDLERKVRQPDEHEAILGHFSKYRSLMPSIALLLHLVDVADGKEQPGPVSLEAAQKAAGWTAYLEQHARRIYGMGIHPELNAARMLAEKIQQGELGLEFTERDVYRRGWTSLNDPKSVNRACETLAGYDGWIVAEIRPTGSGGGRPTTVYRVNPKLLGGKSKQD